MPPSAADLRWVRPPQQARSRQTLDRLLDAAEQLVAEKGFDDTPVAEVARRAGSSVGAFYSRFQDKDGLLHALYERWLGEATATADAALDPARWEGATISEIVTAVVRFLVEIYRERAGLMRAFVLRNHVDSEFHARQERLSHYISERLTRLLLVRRGEIARADPERAAGFGLTLIMSTLESVMLFGEHRTGSLALNDHELGVELTTAYLAYLGVPDRSTR
jgi:AcrR family transcriptional regulator